MEALCDSYSIRMEGDSAPEWPVVMTSLGIRLGLVSELGLRYSLRPPERVGSSSGHAPSKGELGLRVFSPPSRCFKVTHSGRRDSFL